MSIIAEAYLKATFYGSRMVGYVGSMDIANKVDGLGVRKGGVLYIEQMVRKLKVCVVSPAQGRTKSAPRFTDSYARLLVDVP